jgi:hypothetical protein
MTVRDLGGGFSEFVLRGSRGVVTGTGGARSPFRTGSLGQVKPGAFHCLDVTIVQTRGSGLDKELLDLVGVQFRDQPQMARARSCRLRGIGEPTVTTWNPSSSARIFAAVRC